MTEPTRQLPGVKGQWIKVSQYPPTADWADPDGCVRVAEPYGTSWGFAPWDQVAEDLYWIPVFDEFFGGCPRNDPRPFFAQQMPLSVVDQLRKLCAAALIVVRAANGPLQMLDNLSAAANSEPLPHDCDAGLPWMPAEPAPEQAAAGARLFDKLTGNADGSLLWAVADDGTAWERDRAASCTWEQLPSLPDREA